MASTTLPTLLVELSNAFPRNALRPGTLEVYVRELDDLPVDALEPAVRELIRTSEFFPTIRAIRATAAELMLELPYEDDALSQVEARLRWAREPEEEREPDGPEIHALVKEALDHVGGFYAFRSAEQPAVVRGQFLKLYREMRERAVYDVQVDRPALYPATRAIEA